MRRQFYNYGKILVSYKSLDTQMTLIQFAEAVDLFSKSEIEKVKLILLFFQNNNNEFQITIDDISNYFENLGMHKPNKTRLRKNIISSKEFVRGKSPDYFRLHYKVFSSLLDLYSSIINEKKTEEIKLVSDGLVLNKELYEKTRTYLINLSNQINASYEHNIFDGCADVSLNNGHSKLGVYQL